MDDTQRIVKCGNLSLHTPGGFFKKRWHGRYLVLYDGSKSGVKRLELFDSEIKFKKQSPVKIIPLVDCVRIVTCQRHKTTFTFEVRTNDQFYLLASKSFQDMNDWVNCLRFVAFGQAQPASASSPAQIAGSKPTIGAAAGGGRSFSTLAAASGQSVVSSRQGASAVREPAKAIDVLLDRRTGTTSGSQQQVSALSNGGGVTPAHHLHHNQQQGDKSSSMADIARNTAGAPAVSVAGSDHLLMARMARSSADLSGSASKSGTKTDDDELVKLVEAPGAKAISATQAAAAAASALAKTRQRQPSLLGSCKPQPPNDSPFLTQQQQQRQHLQASQMVLQVDGSSSSSSIIRKGPIDTADNSSSAMSMSNLGSFGGGQLDTLTPTVRGQLIASATSVIKSAQQQQQQQSSSTDSTSAQVAPAPMQVDATPLSNGGPSFQLARVPLQIPAALDEEEENMLYCSIEDNPSEHNYRVKVIETELALRCQLKCYQLTASTTISQQYEQLSQFRPQTGAGQESKPQDQLPPIVTFYQLIIGPQELTLLNDYAARSKLHQQQGLWSWPYQCIRRYGFDKDNCFMFEAGRKCTSGPGQFIVQTPKAYNIYQDVVKFVNELRTVNTNGPVVGINQQVQQQQQQQHQQQQQPNQVGQMMSEGGSRAQQCVATNETSNGGKGVSITQIPVTWTPNNNGGGGGGGGGNRLEQSHLQSSGPPATINQRSTSNNNNNSGTDANVVMPALEPAATRKQFFQTLRQMDSNATNQTVSSPLVAGTDSSGTTASSSNSTSVAPNQNFSGPTLEGGANSCDNRPSNQRQRLSSGCHVKDADRPPIPIDSSKQYCNGAAGDSQALKPTQLASTNGRAQLATNPNSPRLAGTDGISYGNKTDATAARERLDRADKLTSHDLRTTNNSATLLEPTSSHSHQQQALLHSSASLASASATDGADAMIKELTRHEHQTGRGDKIKSINCSGGKALSSSGLSSASEETDESGYEQGGDDTLESGPKTLGTGHESSAIRQQQKASRFPQPQPPPPTQAQTQTTTLSATSRLAPRNRPASIKPDSSISSSTSSSTAFSLSSSSSSSSASSSSVSPPSSSAPSSAGNSPGQSVSRKTGETAIQQLNKTATAAAANTPATGPPNSNSTVNQYLDTGLSHNRVNAIKDSAGREQKSTVVGKNNNKSDSLKLHNLITDGVLGSACDNGQAQVDFETSLIRDVYSEITKLHAKFAVTSTGSGGDDSMSSDSRESSVATSDRDMAMVGDHRDRDDDEEEDDDDDDDEEEEDDCADTGCYYMNEDPASCDDDHDSEPLYSNLKPMRTKVNPSSNPKCLMSSRDSNRIIRGSPLDHSRHYRQQQPSQQQYRSQKQAPLHDYHTNQAQFDNYSNSQAPLSLPQLRTIYPTILNPIPEINETSQAPRAMAKRKLPASTTAIGSNQQTVRGRASQIEGIGSNARGRLGALNGGIIQRNQLTNGCGGPVTSNQNYFRDKLDKTKPTNHYVINEVQYAKISRNLNAP